VQNHSDNDVAVDKYPNIGGCDQLCSQIPMDNCGTLPEIGPFKFVMVYSAGITNSFRMLHGKFDTFKKITEVVLIILSVVLDWIIQMRRKEKVTGIFAFATQIFKVAFYLLSAQD
jgi:hypothetical protein